MTGLEEFLSALAEFADEVPAEPIEAVARALESQTSPAANLLEAVAAVRTPATRDRLLQLLRESPEALSPRELALTIRSAAMTATHIRRQSRVDLVWSGPVSRAQRTRTTEQALIEIINDAETEILLVAFAAYRVPSVRRALEAATARGVRITLLAEWRKGRKRTGSGDILGALGPELARSLRRLEWPLADRLRNRDGNPAALHAKIALVDDEDLLITSANLTGDALTINMELGVLIRGGTVPSAVRNLFSELEREGTLRQLSNDFAA